MFICRQMNPFEEHCAILEAGVVSESHLGYAWLSPTSSHYFWKVTLLEPKVTVVIKSILLLLLPLSSYSSFFFLDRSNKGRKPSNRGSGSWGKATGWSVKSALLTRWIDWGLWGWSPTGFGSEEAALLGTGAVGHRAMVRFPRVTFCITVGLSPGDALLLAPPWVVISWVADVMVDKRMGFLRVLIHFVLTVTSL